MLLDQLGEAQGAGQSCGTRADNQHIGFEFFALDGHAAILAEPPQPPERADCSVVGQFETGPSMLDAPPFSLTSWLDDRSQTGHYQTLASLEINGSHRDNPAILFQNLDGRVRASTPTFAVSHNCPYFLV